MGFDCKGTFFYDRQVWFKFEVFTTLCNVAQNVCGFACHNWMIFFYILRLLIYFIYFLKFIFSPFWRCNKYLILQGGEGDCFYVVGSGEFEVLATQVVIIQLLHLLIYKLALTFFLWILVSSCEML